MKYLVEDSKNCLVCTLLCSELFLSLMVCPCWQWPGQALPDGRTWAGSHRSVWERAELHHSLCSQVTALSVSAQRFSKWKKILIMVIHKCWIKLKKTWRCCYSSCKKYKTALDDLSKASNAGGDETPQTIRYAESCWNLTWKCRTALPPEPQPPTTEIISVM